MEVMKIQYMITQDTFSKMFKQILRNTTNRNVRNKKGKFVT